ncbi:MAG TPA: hypothetical protein VK588_14055 [Chitinophagaceae bacterium]|nr:hypothetical protein [Chitinophagaceae bacterium]
MDYDFPKSKFYQAMMTGFFVGFFATIVCLIFNIIFRDSTGFPLSSYINVSTIIFLVNILFPILGIIYYGFLNSFKKADVSFILVFALLTIFLVWRSETVHRTEDVNINSEFKTLLSGVVLILGISATIFIPLLFRSKKFQETVL